MLYRKLGKVCGWSDVVTCETKWSERWKFSSPSPTSIQLHAAWYGESSSRMNETDSMMHRVKRARRSIGSSLPGIDEVWYRW